MYLKTREEGSSKTITELKWVLNEWWSVRQQILITSTKGKKSQLNYSKLSKWGKTDAKGSKDSLRAIRSIPTLHNWSINCIQVRRGFASE